MTATGWQPARDAALDRGLDEREIDLEGRESRAGLHEEAIRAREAALKISEGLANRLRRSSELQFEVAQRRE
jgi:hypothetical protein